VPPFADPDRSGTVPSFAAGPAAPGFDAETAFLYNGTRCYDPTPGRWVSQDPLGFEPDDVSLYRYVGQGGGDGTPQELPNGATDHQPPA
jgi:uncharacterized protein RhaS with RHS repeats